MVAWVSMPIQRLPCSCITMKQHRNAPFYVCLPSAIRFCIPCPSSDKWQNFSELGTLFTSCHVLVPPSGNLRTLFHILAMFQHCHVAVWTCPFECLQCSRAIIWQPVLNCLHACHVPTLLLGSQVHLFAQHPCPRANICRHEHACLQASCVPGLPFGGL